MNRSMPPKLRWSILKRDGFRCAYCGRTAAEGVRLEVDHIVSWADGGRDEPDRPRRRAIVATSAGVRRGRSDRRPSQSKGAQARESS